MIYKKNPDGTFSKKYQTTSNRFDGYVDDDVSIDDPDVVKKRIGIKNENEFKKFIKTKEDGDKFREWVRGDSERLSKVKKELNKNGLSGTLDASGSHRNDYIKLAWNLFGQEFIISSYPNDGVSYFDTLQTEQIQNTEHYKTYKNALSNWNSVSGFFGWSSPKTISSEYIGKITSGEVDVSTCIDPTYVLKEQNKLMVNMFSIDPDKTYEFQQERGFGRHWEEVGLGVTTDEPMYFWDFTDGKIVDREVSDDERRWYDNVILYNKYDHFLNNVIYPHNTIISLQNKNRYNNACDDVHYKTTYKKVWHGNSMGNEPVNHYFKWIDVCKPYGGAFMRSTKPIKEEPGIKSVGFTENTVVCGCVKINDKIKIHGKPITDWVGVGDIRSGWRKFEEGLGDCMTDWHCIADIASIAVLALGPVGVLISGAIDLVNTIGYVVEQEEGWKLNAGLTFLGVIPGFGEAKFLASKGTKFTSKLEDLGKILDVNKGGDIFKLTIDIINKQTKNLNKIDQGVLAKMFKKESHETIQKLLKEANGDVATMVKKYFKGTKQFIAQGVLFAGLHVYSDKLGKGLHWLYEEFGVDPLGLFADDGQIDEKEIVDYDIIISNGEKIDNHINSMGIDESDYEKETKLFLSIVEPIQSLRKTDNSKLKNKLGELYTKFLEIINGKRYKYEDIKPISDIMIPVLNELQNKKDDIDGSIKLIDELISDLGNYDKPKISKKEKTAIIVTGDKDITPEEQNDLINLINELKKDPNTNKEDKIEEGMKLNEEIKRIKTLFTNERLYGNLIDEQCASEDEAKEYLQDKGYIVRDPSSSDLCLGPSSNLGKLYKKYQGDSKLKFQSPSTKSGDCVLGLYRKDKIRWGNNFFLVNLFDGVDGKVFNMYFKVTNATTCEKSISAFSSTFNVVATTKGVDNTKSPIEIGVGLTYVKLEGDWTIDGAGNVNLSNINVVKLMNENKKGISVNVDVGVGFVDLKDLVGLETDGSGAGNGEVLKKSDGTCGTISVVLEEKLGSAFSTGISLDDLITKMTV
jgi:hypothetical protein